MDSTSHPGPQGGQKCHQLRNSGKISQPEPLASLRKGRVKGLRGTAHYMNELLFPVGFLFQCALVGCSFIRSIDHSFCLLFMLFAHCERHCHCGQSLLKLEDSIWRLALQFSENTGIPYAHWSKAQLLHVRAICLLMAWEKHKIKGLGLCHPRGRLERSTYLLASTLPTLADVAI